MLKFIGWASGTRTYFLSVVAFIMVTVLQLDYQETIDLAPMIETGLKLLLPLLMAGIPVYIRKGLKESIDKMKNGSK